MLTLILRKEYLMFAKNASNFYCATIIAKKTNKYLLKTVVSARICSDILSNIGCRLKQLMETRMSKIVSKKAGNKNLLSVKPSTSKRMGGVNACYDKA